MNSITTNIKIEALEARILELEQAGEAITPALSEGIVQHIAGQIQTLFRNPVMLSGITSAILQNLQNALLFRAGKAKEREAQLIVIDYYVPSAQRVVHREDGTLLLETQNMSEGVDPVAESDGEWTEYDFGTDGQASVTAIVQLLKSYNVEADAVRYMITDIDLQAYRESLTKAFNDDAERKSREMAIDQAE
jgi:hypothetical protein